jgi:signal transduction histidine kinase/CheY-like chemotaxis protein
MSNTVCAASIQTEEDVVSARRMARDVAQSLGFDGNDQTRIATAVSEIARNAHLYGHGGSVEFLFDAAQGQLTVRVIDHGPGIPDLKRILGGTYKSKTGMGLGIVGAQRLMDAFHIESAPDRGTVVSLSKRLPEKSPRVTPQKLSGISADLKKTTPRNVLDELREENREMLRVMQELRERQEDMARLNDELEDTNRGVVALYAELDEKAERLRRADQMKSRFLSHMSHEFRTPLTSILALTRLLADESDGKLTAEQQKQVTFIRKSAESLLEMVNDLLDLARVEAGKSVVRPTRFQVSNLFGALRGVLRPLQVNEGVELIMDEPSGLPVLYTDESKLAQILRNFVSNALKFTERGEVRVSAKLSDDGKLAIFSVSDTGIGIPPDQLEYIFQEFAQVDTPMQKRYKGTGLGLPLSKGLAELLGGRVAVESQVGRGSTFSAEIPIQYEGELPEILTGRTGGEVLTIDDEEVSRYLIRQCLGPSQGILEASDGLTGIAMAKKHHPRAILLDLRMPEMTGFEVLRELKADPATRDIRVLIMTSKALSQEELGILSSQAAAVFSKEVLSQPDGGQRIRMAIDGPKFQGTAEQPRGEAPVGTR